MQLTDLTLAGFLCLGVLRCFAFAPQIVHIIRDQNGASAISFTTLWTWTLANFATAFYAEVNLQDSSLAIVSCLQGLCCLAVIGCTVIKRARYRAMKQLTMPVASQNASDWISRDTAPNGAAERSSGRGRDERPRMAMA